MVRYTAVELGSTCPKNVARCMRRQLGSMPWRYQRSSVATANECLRSWSLGGDTPGGMCS